MKYKALITVLAVLLVLTGGLLVVLLASRPSAAPPPPSYYGLTVLPEAAPLPPVALTDDTGTPFTNADLRGQWTLLFFGFTQCPDICPPTMHELKSFVESLGDDVPTPEVVFVSVDPARDSTTALQRYVKGFHPDFVGVTGPEAAWLPLTKFFGVFAEKTPMAMPHDDAADHAAADHAAHDAPSDDYVINHTGSVILIDPQGRFAGVLTPPHVAAEIASAWRAFAKDVVF